MPLPYKSVGEAEKEVIDALYALLSSGYPGSPEKIAAFRQVVKESERMSKNVQDFQRQREKAQAL